MAELQQRSGVTEASRTGGRGRTSRRSEGGDGGADLRKDLRDFVSARPQGWGHDDWINFLESLANRGHNITDREAIGVALEKERLDLALTGIKGVGPQRRNALIDRFGTVWNVRNADPHEIASTAKIPHELAETIKAEMQ